MDNLLFLTNELMNPKVRAKLKLPLTFIGWAIAEGKLNRLRHKTTFFIQDWDRAWGNDVVYGAIFLCKEWSYYSKVLDSYHLCSMTSLMRNHVMDMQHRRTINVTPIYFENLDELSRLKYREGVAITTTTYMGNTNHPTISQRLRSPRSYRLIDGLDKEHYKTLWEVLQ